MTEQRVHEWYVCANRAGEIYAMCRDIRCHGKVLKRDEIEARINKYETLKKATDVLSADVAHQVSIHYKKRWRGIGGGSNFFKRVCEETQAYANILEGK